jgi:WhiB family redox-sensing transcriptional regulator
MTGYKWPEGQVAVLDAGVVPAARVPCEDDPSLWFAESPAQLECAKALCRTCPVREACLEGALARAEPWGVWGGEILQDGAVIARKRPRGRPRKNREHEENSEAA